MKTIVLVVFALIAAVSLGQTSASAGEYTGVVQVSRTKAHVLTIDLTPAKNGQFTVSGTLKDADGGNFKISGTLTKAGQLRAIIYTHTKNVANKVNGFWLQDSRGLHVSIPSKGVEANLRKKSANEVDLSGNWKVRLSSQYGYVDVLWVVQKIGPGKWRADQTLLDTDHPVHKPRIGQKLHSYTIVRSKEGMDFDLTGGDSDPNPYNPGSFTQTAKLTISGGKLSGKGTHKGSQLTHPFQLSGSRSK